MHFKYSCRQGGGGVRFSYENILGGTVFMHHTFLKTRYASPLSRQIIYGLTPPWPGVKLTEELGELQDRKTRTVTTIFYDNNQCRIQTLRVGPKNVFSCPSPFGPQFGPKVERGLGCA